MLAATVSRYNGRQEARAAPLLRARTQTPAAPPTQGDGEAAFTSTVPNQLLEAIGEQARAPQRVYYDATADEQARKDYYVPLQEPTFASLSKLLNATHRTQLAYQPSRQLYPWIDLHPDLKLRSIYSGRTFDPEELIRRDSEVDRLRAQRFRELVASRSFFGAEEMRQALEGFEGAVHQFRRRSRVSRRGRSLRRVEEEH